MENWGSGNWGERGIGERGKGGKGEMGKGNTGLSAAQSLEQEANAAEPRGKSKHAYPSRANLRAMFQSYLYPRLRSRKASSPMAIPISTNLSLFPREKGQGLVYSLVDMP